MGLLDRDARGDGYALPALDDRDRQIVAERAASLVANVINVGDWIVYPDGAERRVSYVWPGDDEMPGSIQTTAGGSFCLGDGYVSYSGSLYHGIPFATCTLTDARRDGQVWIFHHDWHCAHNGVSAMIPFRVWRTTSEPEEC